VWDDGSTDGGPDWLLNQEAAQLRVIRSQSSCGVAASLNKLAAATDSEFIARMDADDVCLPDRFVRQLNRLGKCDLLFSSVDLFSGRDDYVGRELPGVLRSAAMALHLAVGNVLRHPTLFARRKALDDLGWYSEETPAEDYDLWLRAVASGARVERSAFQGIRYRMHENQISSSSPWSRLSTDKVLDESYASLVSPIAQGLSGDDYSSLRLAAVSARRGHVDPELWSYFVMSLKRAALKLDPLSQLQLRLRIIRRNRSL